MQITMTEATATTHATGESGGNASGSRPRSALERYDGLIRIVSVVVIVVGLFLIMQTLPVAQGVALLESWVESFGIWGPIVFGTAYIVAAVLFVPGAALTLAAGAIFGLFWGFITVSLASTTAAAIAFLIGRYVARDAVSQQAARYPKFKAIDRAIGEQGWKIVALLRLAAIFPFSVGNYLLGLTSVRFWPYVLASWIAMMPGTFMYVYFGYLGRAGVEATGDQRSILELIMLGVGLLAIIGLVVFIVRFALRALAAHTDIKPDSKPETASAGQTGGRRTDAERGRRPIWRKLLLPGSAAVVLVLGACAQRNPDWLSRLFGPPAVTMTEAYEVKPHGPTFDHALFDRQLREYVSDEDGGGWIDYAAWKARDRDALRDYITKLGEADYGALGRNEKLALLINAYNAFTIELIFEYWDGGDLESIQDIPSDKRWDHQRWRIGDNVWSLNQIEHEQIRPNFKEPRIHWAVVCAAIGCPPLRREAYTGERIDEQLDDQGRIVHTHQRWFRYDREANVVHLTRLYEWYRDDYAQVDGSILAHAAKYVPELREALERGRAPRVRWIDYDWSLNHREHVK